MNWNIVSKLKVKSEKLKVEDIEKVLLENRGISSQKDKKEFLNPKLSDVTLEIVGIDKRNLRKALDRIKKAIRDGEEIVVYGDYDVDGICGTAILWETLKSLGANVMPYIPHRIDEGYGLSEKGISNMKAKFPKTALVITVDNGIVANDAVSFANKKGLDVIITDHHVPGKKLPDTYAIVHTTKLCGTGVAYLLAQELRVKSEKLKVEDSLELVALATVADLVPLIGPNRVLLKFGLEALNKTERPGLLELFKEAGIEKGRVGVYEIGHIIAPRLNATGRIEHAMDSLRLICTKDAKRARELAFHLGNTNKSRKEKTEEAKLHAVSEVLAGNHSKQKLLFVAHETYQPGVIGLVASRLVEEFYKPAIVISVGKKVSKASARSVSGFNIIEFLRVVSSFLEDVGGHPMAAGFTVKTENIARLKKELEELSQKLVKDHVLTKSLRVDCELPIEMVGQSLFETIEKLSPFGMGNPQPTFLSKSLEVLDLRLVGQDGKHLRLAVRGQKLTARFDAIAFGFGERIEELRVGDKIDIVYTIEQEEWNGEKRLKLKIKDFKNDGI